MANIFDYILWRGDLTFNEAPFNDIDNLILARISYFPFDNTIAEDENITVKEAYERFEKFDIEKLKILQKEDIDLFPMLAKSKRFGNLSLIKYIEHTDKEKEKQFGAVTIILPDKTSYISFRGTDDTLVGWKEDFNMSFMELVPSQIDAMNYLNMIAKHIKGSLRVGGHSKGGNLAVYASAFCNKSVKKRIIEIYNNDGPGFFESVTKTEDYKEILHKIHTFIPQSSVIGRLLNHEEKYIVIRSTQTGLLQHDLYSWQLLGNKFICLDEVTNGSKFIDRTISEWLISVTPEQRGKFADALFEILNSTNAETLSDISAKWFTNTRTLLTTYRSLDEETKEIISKTFFALLNIAKQNVLGKDKNRRH